MAKGFLEVFPGLTMEKEFEELLKLAKVPRVTSTRDRSSIRIYINSKRLIHKKNITALEKGIGELVLHPPVLKAPSSHLLCAALEIPPEIPLPYSHFRSFRRFKSSALRAGRSSASGSFFR